MLILQFVKKYFWVINILFIISAAYLSSNAVNMHIASSIGSTPKFELSSKGLAASKTNPALNDFQIVLDRNIFNAQSVLKERFMAALAAAGGVLGVADMELLGTVAGSPLVSLALILKKTGDRAVKAYKWGEKVGDYEIVSIERRLVKLRKEGDQEIKVLKMPDEPSAPLIANRTTNAEDIAEGITKVNDDEMIIDRSVVDKSFDNFSKLMRQARIIPNLKGGKIDGFKIYRIKDKSLFKQIGLQNGDIIHRVNGNEIEGPEDALKLFEIFKTARSISIDLDRKGAKKTLSYSIR